VQLIVVDEGRWSVKAVSKDDRKGFLSLVGEVQDQYLSAGGDYEVTIDGKKHYVGQKAKDESFCVTGMATESKLHPESKILILTAVGLLAKPDEPVNLVTGLPVSQHTPIIKQKFAELLEGWHQIEINGEKKSILINEVGIVPEAGGAYWHTVLDDEGEIGNSFISNQNVRVIDIGSRTINYCTLKMTEYINRDSGTLPYGTMELVNADKCCKDDAKNVAEEIKESFARRIFGDLSRKWLKYEPNNDLVLLTGGGSILLQQYLEQHFMVSQLVNTVYANAEGFYKMGVRKWGK